MSGTVIGFGSSSGRLIGKAGATGTSFVIPGAPNSNSLTAGNGSWSSWSTAGSAPADMILTAVGVIPPLTSGSVGAWGMRVAVGAVGSETQVAEFSWSFGGTTNSFIQPLIIPLAVPPRVASGVRIAVAANGPGTGLNVSYWLHCGLYTAIEGS